MLINKYAGLALPWAIAGAFYVGLKVSDDKSKDGVGKKVAKTVGLADKTRKRRK